MANSDKLWFELGVRDNVSKVLENLLSQAEALGVALDEAKLNKNLITNAETCALDSSFPLCNAERNVQPSSLTIA